jgi:very-short-patch-repair endonuclease
MTNQAVRQTQAARSLENLRTKLLDLTKRNVLINYKHPAKRCLRLIDLDMDEVGEQLQDGRSLKLTSLNAFSEADLIRHGFVDEDGKPTVPTKGEWARACGLDPSYDLTIRVGGTEEERRLDRLHALLFSDELERRLHHLYQLSESAIQEMGVNILHLAFGFLEWRESRDSELTFLAPLFMIPVRLQKSRLDRTSGTFRYELSSTGEDVVTNFSLMEKLRIDTGLDLPTIEEETTPRAYLNDVENLVHASCPEWRVRRFATLALLNFSKMRMYRDLDPANWEANSLLGHRNVTRFLVGEEEDSNTGPEDLGFGEEYDIDTIPEIHKNYPLIDDADSSQHSAIVDALDGQDLVIEGPPGTGKSQTITNLVAGAMARGKTVLFVAEKLEALRVVKQRIDRVGLGEFCLELHSHKARKSEVIGDLNLRLEHRRQHAGAREFGSQIESLEHARIRLQKYVDLLHGPWKETGLSIYQVLSKAVRYRLESGSHPAHPADLDGDAYTPRFAEELRSAVEVFQQAFLGLTQEVAERVELSEHPWYGVQNLQLLPTDTELAAAHLRAWQQALDALEQQLAAAASVLSIGRNQISDLDLARELSDLMLRLPHHMTDAACHTLEKLEPGKWGLVPRGVELATRLRNARVQAEEQHVLGVDVEPEILHEVQTNLQRMKHMLGPESAAGTMDNLAQSLKGLRAEVAEVAEPMEELADAIGEAAEAFLQPTQEGLEEFLRLVELLASLDANLVAHRGDKMLHGEVDEAIKQLEAELNAVNRQADELSHVFQLRKLRDPGALRTVLFELRHGSIFSFLSGKRRRLKGSLLDLAVHSGIRFRDMEPLLGLLDHYAELLEAFQSKSPEYERDFGKLFQGLDTDHQQIRNLREWHQHFQQAYPFGLGKKAAYARSLFVLPSMIVDEIRAMRDGGLPGRIRNVLDQLEPFAQAAPDIGMTISCEASLVGPRSWLGALSEFLARSREQVALLPGSDAQSIHIIEQRLGALGEFLEASNQWEQDKAGSALFDQILELDPDTLATTGNADSFRAFASYTKTLEDCPVGMQVHAGLRKLARSTDLEDLRKRGEQLRTCLEEEAEACKTFRDLVELDSEKWFGNSLAEIGGRMRRNARALEKLDQLVPWTMYLRYRDVLVRKGFELLVTQVEQGEVAGTGIVKACLASTFDLLSRQVLTAYPELIGYTALSQEEAQKRFQNLDHKLKAETAKEVARKANDLPVPSGWNASLVRDKTELALIRHECGKKTRHLSIRQLVNRAGQALQGLKPCFMMSPLSVAQYLPPGKLTFDLVIMDEASQIRPEDALGALARGGQLVVVGDPKQLPPTNFFNRVTDEDRDDVTGLEESESILDAAMDSFRLRRLRWHYRSRHESLIAFSNREFYDSSLVVFPSPVEDGDEFGIRHHFIEQAIFEDRRNTKEARSIARHVRKHVLSRSGESIGVVAMNVEQRQQIEDEIELLAKDDRRFQSLLERNGNRLFVKNLENVQGDERDVIVLSMTYGPARGSDRVRQSFGPILQDAGWRRLNVLFTRARKRMHVFTSMSDGDIHVEAASKRGVRALKAFLAYARTGVLCDTREYSDRPPDSDFEIAVADALAQHGFECQPQVGVAGFFIDLGVRDPGQPGRFLMGIECDGATYHSAKSARDRDRLRQEILQGLGWRIRRIWSTDWFLDPEKCLRPIIEELHGLKTSCELVVEEPEEAENDAEVLGFARPDESLEDALYRFQEEVIQAEFRDTPPGKQLLREEMVEALIRIKPRNHDDFLDRIPIALRMGTEARQGKYLSRVFEVIQAF